MQHGLKFGQEDPDVYFPDGFTFDPISYKADYHDLNGILFSIVYSDQQIVLHSKLNYGVFSPFIPLLITGKL